MQVGDSTTDLDGLVEGDRDVLQTDVPEHNVKAK
jgi:hypothetical protein